MTIEKFRGCRFFCGETNKIERELKKGHNVYGDYHYDLINFSVVESVVTTGHVCLDVGANIGVYSNIFASLSGDAANVHAFEPVRHIRNKLLANSKLNGHSEINVNSFALGDVETQMTMFQIKPGHRRGGVSSLMQNDTYKELGKEHFDEVVVPVLLLDNYVEQKQLPSVDFIKIDVEGFEMNVLRGGRKTVSKYRPFIILELDFDRHGKEIGAEMCQYFADLDYRAFEPEMKNGVLPGKKHLTLTPYNFNESPKRRNIFLLP
ncbi:hypothetical protein ASG68_18875 [Rhizobium sp. Leaf453]|nr:hypothetical protein ASG50_20485 [Rhizobium sp. Leaf386]KQT05437.1 hypothetical protein ASG42_21225 [Rhizobium sp. Leaf391]KQT91879.1 hypothetical protein ASG68_18875 [Rhizobium sp. Leaf453]